MIEIRNKHLLFVDVETSGFDWLKNDLLTWSGIITDFDFNILDKRTVKSQVTCYETWGERAAEVHGISLFEAQRFQKPRDACIEILNFLKPFKHKDNFPLVWFEHSNNWIDILFTKGLFLKNELLASYRKIISRENQISSIKVARNAGYTENKLNQWADRLDIKLDHHNSEADAMALYEVVKFLAKNKVNKEDIYNLINISKSKINREKL